MPASFVYDAVRTPFARHAKAFADVRPDDLAATVMASVVERTGLDPARIEDVIFGDANQPAKTTATSRASARCSRASPRRCPARPSTACADRRWMP